MPPHSRFTCVFKTKTSGLSNEGRPSKLGAWASPMLFKVPKVKNEKPKRKFNFMYFHKKANYLLMHHHHKQKAAITKWNYFPNLIEVFLKQKEIDK